MFSSALKVLALAAVALALPATEFTNATTVSGVGDAVEIPKVLDATVRVLSLCTGAYPYVGCSNLPTNNGVCINIPASLFHSGGARVPSSTICTFYRNANCPTVPRADMVPLTVGIYDLTHLVRNAEGNLVAFGPRRSYLCRPGGPAL